MNVLVTGSAGFIGSHLVRALRARGDDWIGSDPRERVLPVDRIPDVDAIVHLGAITDTRTDEVEALIETNVGLSKDLFRFAAEWDIPFVYASSASVYGAGEKGFDDERNCYQPLNPYGKSKLAFDRWISSQSEYENALFAGLRFFNVYGPGEESKGPMASMVSQAVWAVEQNVPIRLFRWGEQRRDFVSVFDVVDVILAFLDGFHPVQSGIYNVGSGVARSFEEMARAVGARYDFVEMPARLRPRYQSYTRADLRRLRGIGYDARFRSLEEGLATYSSVPRFEAG